MVVILGAATEKAPWPSYVILDLLHDPCIGCISLLKSQNNGSSFYSPPSGWLDMCLLGIALTSNTEM